MKTFSRRIHTQGTTLGLIGIIAFLALATSARLAPAGSLTFLRQSGSITVHGELGTFGETAPTDRPWFTNVHAGAGGPIWFAQSFMFSSWTDTRFLVYTESLVSPGAGAPRLTQSLTDLTVDFRADTPTDVRLDFIAAPDQAGPNVTLNQHAMRLINVGSGAVLAEGFQSGRIVSLTPGVVYRIEAHNTMGNVASNFALSEGARMLSIDLNVVVPAPGSAAILAGLVCVARRRTRSVSWVGG